VTTEDIGGQGRADRELGGRYTAKIGSSQAQPQTAPIPQLRGGGARRAFYHCARCTHCPCHQDRNFVGGPGLSPAQPSSSILHRHRSSSSRRRPRTPTPSHSPEPPQLWREPSQPKGGCTLSWDEAQAQFSLGAEAMSQGSEGSPVLFLDPAACDNILTDLRSSDGSLSMFDSDPGSPPPAFEAEVACGE